MGAGKEWKVGIELRPLSHGLVDVWGFYHSKGNYGRAYPKTLHNIKMEDKVTMPR